MTKLIKSIQTVGGAIVAISIASAANAGERPKVDDALLAKGKSVYAHECASCHGVEGDGKGPGARYLNPKPRNFALGVYKLRSTPNGEVPTDDDLFETITLGIDRSMMPGFASLSERDRWALVEVIKRFGGIEEEKAQAIPIPAEPKITQASLDNGEKLYVKLKCGTCHGEKGQGDGPSSLGLKNDAKERIYPTDFTMGVYKGGAEPKNVFKRIATGLDGSPMPSYAAEAKPKEIWDLVHYIKSLATVK